MAVLQCIHGQLNVFVTSGRLTFFFLAAGLASSLEALTRLFLLITKPLRVPWGAIILHQVTKGRTSMEVSIAFVVANWSTLTA